MRKKKKYELCSFCYIERKKSEADDGWPPRARVMVHQYDEIFDKREQSLISFQRVGTKGWTKPGIII